MKNNIINMIKTISVICVILGVMLVRDASNKKGNGLFSDKFFISSAFAATSLDQAELVRFLYWLINGPPSSGYPSGYDGPDGGFLGMIRDLTGPDALGGGLNYAGYTTCESIPTSGSASMTEDTGTFTMTFSTSSKTKPTGWTGAGDNYAKRVEVNYDDGSSNVDFMAIEFDCDRTTGWIRFFEPHDNSGNTSNSSEVRHLEVYYDTTDSDAIKMELYMKYEPASNNDEYFLVKFETLDSTKYKIWITRAATENAGTSWEGFKSAIHGTTELGGLALTNIIISTDPANNTVVSVDNDTGNVTVGDDSCIDFNSGGSATDGSTVCASNGLANTTPGSPIIDNTGSFNMQWVRQTLSSKLTSL